MSEAKVLYLSRKDVESVNIQMAEIITVLESMFAEKGAGRVEMPPKPGIHTRPDAFIHAMPAYIPALDSAGMKWVAGYPENHKRGLPYISGLIVLNDPDTGLPLCIMDCTWVTAKYLARADSETLAILGCGVQGFSNAEALQCVLPLRKIKAYDVADEAAVRYREKVEKVLGLEVEIVSSPEAAVRGSDVVVTAGPLLKNPDPVIEESLGLEVEIVSSPEAAVRGSDVVVTAGPLLKNPDPVIEESVGAGSFRLAGGFRLLLEAGGVRAGR